MNIIEKTETLINRYVCPKMKIHDVLKLENQVGRDGFNEVFTHTRTIFTMEKAKKNLLEGNLLNRADKYIGDAFRFFMNAVSDLYEAKGKTAQILIDLRNAVRDITFVNITATTEEDSYTIFEILNARGMDLEDHELLKNYIMRYIQPEENRDKAKIVWTRIEDSLGRSNLIRFVRHYTTHKYGDYRSRSDSSDYKIIQDRNKGKETWALLIDLERKANYYLKLVAPSKTGENANCSEVEYRIFSFFKKKRQEQMRPVLLSLISRLTEETLTQQLYDSTIVFLYNFYVCYNIIGEENSNRLTNIVNKFSAKIDRDKTDDSINRFVEELRRKLPTESMFLNAFKNVGWSHCDSIYNGEKNKTRVQTILEIFERYHNNGNCIEDFTIEHVFLDSADPANGQIGNLIPLEDKLNQRCKDKDFVEKLQIYAESAYSTARRFSKRYSEHGFIPEHRTEYMAREFYEKILRL